MTAEAAHGFCEPAGERHRVECAGTPVQQCCGYFLSAGGVLARLAGEQLDRRAPTFPLFFATAQIGFATGVVRHVQRTFAAQLAIDVVFVDQAEHQRRRGTEHLIQLTADVLAEPGFDLVRWNPQPGIDQPDIAPRASVPRAMGLKHGDPLALLQHMNRCRQPGDARANHAHIDRQFALERLGLRPLRCQLFPQTFFA